jgi:hypothetical protein
MTMKKIVLGLLLVMIAVSAEAREIEPGTLKLSGTTNVSFFNTTEDSDGVEDTDTNTLSLEADAVYFVTGNIGVGGSLIFENSETDFSAAAGGGRFDSKTFIIGPTIAVDVPITEALNFIADATIGIFQMELEDEVGKLADADGLAYQLSAGVAMFPAKQVSLDLIAQYQVLDGEDTASDVDIKQSSMGINLGVSVYFD